MNTINRQNPLLAKLTLDEKVSLLSGQDEWTTKNIGALIPSVWMSDGPHGLRKSPDSATGGYGDQLPATCFPTASALAATWDKSLIKEVGRYLAEECKAHNVDMLLGPGVNIKRSPCGGRNFEYFSEDPVLAGELGASYINGLQENHVGTSLKHFAANSQETKRMVVSSNMDQRTLRETYLKAFEIAVKKSAPWSVMASYNPINGIDGTAHKQLLTDVLRKEWGFDGCVISDWVAVYDRIEGIKAGMNIQMPGNGGIDDLKVIEAVKAGKIKESEIDACLESTLVLVEKVLKNRESTHNFDAEKSHAFARKVAADSLVLLKNNGNLLPLDPTQSARLALIGEFAEHPRTQGNGSSEVKPTRLDNLKDELTKLAGKDIQIDYSRGYSTEANNDTQYICTAVETAKNADVAILHIGLPNDYESEGIDRNHINLPPAQVQLVEQVIEAQPKTVIVLTNGSAVSMPWVENAPAILETWLCGQAGAGAIADVLFGEVNPSGKLAETFPIRHEDTPAYLDFPSDGKTLNYSEGIFVGYKWYEKRKIKPLFPFGHGLTYTHFEYGPLNLSSKTIQDTETLDVQIDVKNSGDVSGSEVIQFYLSGPNDSRVKRSIKELKSFSKVQIEPEETVTVSATLSPHDFAYYDENHHQWVTESGTYTLYAAASSADVRQCATFRINSNQQLPIRFDRRTTLKEWITIPETKLLAYDIVKTFFEATPGLHIGDLMDFNIPNGFFLDMPLSKYDGLSRGEIRLSDIDDAIEKANALTFKV